MRTHNIGFYEDLTKIIYHKIPTLFLLMRNNGNKHGLFARILLSSSFSNRPELEFNTIDYIYPYVQMTDLYKYVYCV